MKQLLALGCLALVGCGGHSAKDEAHQFGQWTSKESKQFGKWVSVSTKNNETTSGGAKQSDQNNGKAYAEQQPPLPVASPVATQTPAEASEPPKVAVKKTSFVLLTQKPTDSPWTFSVKESFDHREDLDIRFKAYADEGYDMRYVKEGVQYKDGTIDILTN